MQQFKSSGQAQVFLWTWQPTAAFLELSAVRGDTAERAQLDLLFASTHCETHTVFKKFAALVAAVSLSVLHLVRRGLRPYRG